MVPALYTYDANGNTLSDPSGKSYTWDFENRLTQAIVPGTNGGTTTFKYDPFGRRIQKSGPLGTTNYLYDGPNLVEEADSSGNVLARYTATTDMDEPLAELGAATVSYYQQDAIGSVSSLTSSTATLASSYTYDSFGRRTASSGSISNPFQYTSREFDPETGIYFYRARYYDPSVGRFLSEDEVGNDEGTDLYVYVGSSPIGSRDPTGYYKLKGFSPQQQTQMQNAINEVIEKLNGGKCASSSCAGPDAPKVINAMQKATFVYKPDLKDCAQTWPLHSLLHHIDVGGKTLDGKCCSVASTLAHEAYHLAGAGEPEAYKLEKDCFNCGTGHPPAKQ
jgi:RHS repeat-associated protein